MNNNENKDINPLYLGDVNNQNNGINNNPNGNGNQNNNVNNNTNVNPNNQAESNTTGWDYRNFPGTPTGGVNVNLSAYNETLNAPKQVEEVPKKKSKLPIILVILVLLVIGGGAFYYFYLNNKVEENVVKPIEVYKKAINKAYEVAQVYYQNDNLGLSINPLEDSFYLEGGLQLTTNIEEIEFLNNMKFNAMAGLDYKNKEGALEVELAKDITNLKILGYLKNDIEYIQYKDIFDKVINVGEIELFSTVDSFIKELNLDELENIDTLDAFRRLRDIIIDTLDESKFESLNETVTLDGKSYQVRSIKYHMDKDNIERTIKDIKDKFQNDEVLKEFTDSNSLISMLESLIQEKADISTDDITYKPIDIVFYVDSEENILGGSLIDATNEKELLQISNIEDNLKIISEDDSYSVTLTEYSGYYELYFLNKKNNMSARVIAKEDGSGSYSITAAQGSLDFTYKNVVNKEEEASFDFGLNFRMKGSDNKFITLAINNGHFGVKKGEFSKLDISNAVSIDEISQEEMLEFEEKAKQIMVDLGFEEDTEIDDTQDNEDDNTLLPPDLVY